MISNQAIFIMGALWVPYSRQNKLEGEILAEYREEF